MEPCSLLMVSPSKMKAVVLLSALLVVVSGHGRLLEPPSRGSAWRLGFETPPNYSDNQLFCGGAQNQWTVYGGRCGVCGDPFQGPREHEAGGRYATGTIVRTYNRGAEMEVTVELTANHLGYFEMRLCPHNDPESAVSEDCLNRHFLALSDGSGTRFMVTGDMRMVSFFVRLPEDVVCTQCVVQWKYNTGNNWGTDFDTGTGCKGCGPQEQFYGCADIAITDDGAAPTGSTASTSAALTKKPSTVTQPPPSSTTHRPTTPAPKPSSTRKPSTKAPGGGGGCRAIGAHAARAAFHQWCINNCSRGFCPSFMCACD